MVESEVDWYRPGLGENLASDCLSEKHRRPCMLTAAWSASLEVEQLVLK